MLRWVTMLHALCAIISRLGAVIACTALLLILVAILADVSLRPWFAISSTKLQELQWHLNGVMFLSALGWAYARGAHVRIELVSQNLSPRALAWVDLLASLLLLFPYALAVLVFAFDYTAISFAFDERSASPVGLDDRWAIKAMIPVGFIMLLSAALARFIEAFAFLSRMPDWRAALKADDVYALAHKPEGQS